MPVRKPRKSLIRNPIRGKENPVASRIRFRVLKNSTDLIKMRKLRGEIAEAFTGEGISVKRLKSKRGKRYAVFIDDNPSPELYVHEFQHGRQIIYHHEKIFPLNKEGLLAKLEEDFFTLLTLPRLPTADPRALEFLIDNLHSDNISRLSEGIASVFPENIKDRLRIVSRLYRDYSIRPALEILNEKTYWVDAVNSKQSKYNIQKALKDIVHFLIQERIKIAGRHQKTI